MYTHLHLESLKKYKKAKQYFSQVFKANESTVQKCADELISIAKENGGIITPTLLLSFASNSSTYLYSVFNWSENAEEVRTAQALTLLQQIPVLIGSDNKVYYITIKNEE